MTDGAWTLASGDGEVLIDGGNIQEAVEIVAVLDTYTPSKIRVYQGGDPRRVGFGGSAGFGGIDTDHTGSSITVYMHGFQLEFERVFYFVPWSLYASGQFADRLWWTIPPGISWWLRPSWVP